MSRRSTSVRPGMGEKVFALASQMPAGTFPVPNVETPL